MHSALLSRALIWGKLSCKGSPFKASLVFFASTYKDSVADITALPGMAKEKSSTDYWACFFPHLCVCAFVGDEELALLVYFKDSWVHTTPSDLGTFGSLRQRFQVFFECWKSCRGLGMLNDWLFASESIRVIVLDWDSIVLGAECTQNRVAAFALCT